MRILLRLVGWFVLGLGSLNAWAQLPPCGLNNELIYEVTGGSIFTFNLFQPLSATNPVLNTIALPVGASGALAVSRNLNDPTAPSPTFYGIQDGKYIYYNGSSWINTGHHASSVNLGGAGPYIYNLYGGNVYRYDGTGDDVLVYSLPGYDPMTGPVADVIGDCEGNFYLLKCTTPDAWLRKYDPNGVLLQEWGITNPPLPNTGGGGGYAIIGNLLFVQTLTGSFSGTVGADSITLAPAANGVNAQDMGSCPFDAMVSDINDTVYACSAEGVMLRAQADPPYSYTVLNGSASVRQDGDRFYVTPSSFSTVVLYATIHSACSGDYPHVDTFHVVPAPVLDAGPDDTLFGCGTWEGRLQGSLRNRTPWVDYTINWAPASRVIADGNTLSPIARPIANTTYVLEVSTAPEQGNCLMRDSVDITVVDASVTADFTFELGPGCTGDTVHFTNLSMNYDSVRWAFGNGHTDTAVSPTHVFGSQAVYPVRLTVWNAYCEDTFTKEVDTRHALLAGFTVSADSVCQSEETVVEFTDTSVGAASCYWDFGDGVTSTMQHPSHTFTRAGTHMVMQVVGDQIPCYDTAYHPIYVDSTPFLQLRPDKIALCAGEEVHFDPAYVPTAQGLQWDLGDAVFRSELQATSHSYEASGSYWVKAEAQHAVCASAHDSVALRVYPLPEVDLGDDSSICLHGQPVYLKNLRSAPLNPYHQIWSTGDSTEVLKVVHPGVYTLSVTTEPVGCTTTESITISKDCYIDIPNAFTPDGDGHNDYFFPRQLLGESLSRFRMQVFNRWGQVVFETNRIDGRGWDGRFNGEVQPMDVYLYRIEADFANGRQESYEGNVTLLR